MPKSSWKRHILNKIISELRPASDLMSAFALPFLAYETKTGQSDTSVTPFSYIAHNVKNKPHAFNSYVKFLSYRL